MEEITLFFSEIITSQLFLLALTVVAYAGSKMLYERFPIMILSPVVASSAVVILFLLSTGVEFEQYYEANSILNFVLGVSVICFGYLMHKNFDVIKKLKYSILISTFVGSLLGVVSVIFVAKLFGCEDAVVISIEPKSVSMPIALSICESMGGIPAITSLSVIIAGVGGNIVGVKIFEIFGINDPVAKGLALGSASHVVGTARATELGVIEGAVGGAAIGIMGIFTSIIIPIIKSLLQ